MAVVRVDCVQGEGPTSGPRPTVKQLILAVLDRFSCGNIHLFFALVIVTSVIGHAKYRFSFHAVRSPTLTPRNFWLFFYSGSTPVILAKYSYLCGGAWGRKAVLSTAVPSHIVPASRNEKHPDERTLWSQGHN